MLKSHALVAFVCGTAMTVIFAPALTGRFGFAYRDAAHFYRPLFELVQAEWSAGRVPLWNPYENLGQPLAGDATSSVFYPGKLLFALPLDFAHAFNLYVVAHVALAAGTSFRLARRIGASPLGAGLAAIAYSLSGNVLFQYSNVVFLVGAAWLPLALESGDRMLRGNRWRAALALGLVLALMVTGGDPQMAYNAILLVGLEGVVLWRSGQRMPSDADPQVQRAPGWRCLLLLAIAAGVGALLSAVQVLPAWEAARNSTRAAYEAPRNVYELAAGNSSAGHGNAAHRWYTGLIGASPDGHAYGVYQFNVGPWRAIELVWPNVSGRHFPINTRWLDVVPAEGRVWAPSLYLGLLPFVLGMASFSLRRAARPTTRWLSWLTLLSALAATGVFGLAWWLREIASWFGGSLGGSAGDEVGGFYWLMTVFLPGYVYFRYPAKLLVVTSLGLSMLAALGWDRMWANPHPRWWRFFAALAMASGLACLVLNLAWPFLVARLQPIAPDELFGPFDGAQARIEITRALLHAAVASALLAVLLRIAASRRVRRAEPLPISTANGIVPLACLLLTAVDLVIAQRPLIQYASAAEWSNRAPALEAPGANARVYRDPYCWNNTWRGAGSPDRLLDNLAWERATLFPKHNLPLRIALAESKGALTSLDVQLLWDVARGHASQEGSLPDESVLRMAGVGSVIARERTARGGAPLAEGVALYPLPNEPPRAWIVHDVELLNELRDNSQSAIRRRAAEVLFKNGRARDWSREAVVESDGKLPRIAALPIDASQESCRIIGDEPQRVEIEAQLASGGLVVLADAYDPGWKLAVETGGAARDVEILRTNRVLRGAALPAGQHRLVFRYRPATFYWGATISAISLLALVTIAAVSRTKSPGKAGG